MSEKSVAQWMSGIAMLGVVALFLAAFYAYPHFKQWQLEVNTKINTEKPLPAFVEKQELQALQKELNDVHQALKQKNNEPELFASVKSFIFVANERLQVAQDVSGALAQLKLAQEQLSVMTNPALSELKASIANDINQLSQIPSIDKQAVWIETGSLFDLLNALNFKELMAPVKPVPTVSLSFQSWQSALQSSWDEFKSLIRVSRIEQNPIPLTGLYEEQNQLKIAIQQWVIQAQWAVLQSQQKIYTDSLEKIEDTVKKYYVDNAALQTYLQHTTELKSKQVSIALPNLSNTLQAFSQASRNIKG